VTAADIRSRYAPDLRGWFGQDPESLSDAQILLWFARRLKNDRELASTFRDDDSATFRI
jgi:hypothetical protein